MSLIHANPLLYLNMGGEMLYVLRQRLKAQKIAVDKSIQVLDEVSGALINPAIISSIFQQNATPIDIPMIRANLERAVLSSIMRLDETSMSKLFDLMIMMVKYQISAATGPRELLLITLNHIDVMRDLLIDPRCQESLVLVHRMLIQLYGNYTYDQMWQTRRLCLSHLDSYNVRVSILLRLDLQNENGTFKLPVSRNYDERYEEQRNKDELSGLRLLGNSCQGCNIGSLDLIGNRVTNLGRNMYIVQSCVENRNSVNSRREARALIFKGEPGSKAELGMLAMQLGSNDDFANPTDDDGRSSNDESAKKQARPFTLRLFTDNCDYVKRDSSKETTSRRSSSTSTILEDTVDNVPTNDSISNNQHKAKLHDICANFLEEEEETRASFARKMELLELMDQLE